MKIFYFLSLLILFTGLAGKSVANTGNWRWRADNGDLATATWLAAENTTTTLSGKNNIRLRVEYYGSTIDNSGGTAQLSYRTSSSGTYTQITTDGSSNDFKLSLTDHYADGDVTTGDLLTNYSDKTASNGLALESTFPYFYINSGESKEFEICIQPTENAISGQTYYFKFAGKDASIPITLTYLGPPVVTTGAVSNIGANTATGNGNITNLGASNPTQYGICWNTTGAPTITDSKTEEGATSATGAFTSSLAGLDAETTYYVRAYATNSEGTGYGSEESFTTLSAPIITSMPDTVVAYDNIYNYNISATVDDDLPTTLTAPTLPGWLTLSPSSSATATQIGNIPAGVKINGVSGDNEGNIYAITSKGDVIYKITDDGTTTVWASGLSNNYNVYDFQVAGGYIYFTKYTKDVYRIALDDPAAGETAWGGGSFNFGPAALAHKNDSIYVSTDLKALIFDAGDPWIIKIDTLNGSRENYLSTAGELDANDQPALGMTFSSDGKLYMVTNTAKSIVKYDGVSFSTVLSGFSGNITDIEQDASGNFYVAIKKVGVRKYTNDFSSYVDLPGGTTINDWRLGLVKGSIVYLKYGTNEIYRFETQAKAILSGTPTKEQLGEYDVVIRAANDNGYTEQSFTINVIDTIKPEISVLSPADEAIDVALKPTLTITFDEEVELGTSGILALQGGSTVIKSFDLSITNDRNAFTLSSDKKTLSVDITESLPPDSTINIAISAAFVSDTFDNEFAGFTAASGAWNFTTIASAPPTVVTASITTISMYSAKMGGNVTNEGTSAVTERGVVCSSTDATPTIGEPGVIKDANGSGTGIFSETMGSLSSGTKYYVQAYAINSDGTSYGGVVSFVTETDKVAPEVQCNAMDFVISSDSYYTLTEEDIAALSSGTTDNVTSYEDLDIRVSPGKLTCANEGGTVIKVYATDEAGNESMCMVVVGVIIENSSPSINLIEDVTTDEDVSVSVALSGLWSGKICDRATTVTASHDGENLISDLKVTHNASEATGTLDVELMANQSGTAEVTVEVVNNDGDRTTTSFALTVNPVNDAPVLVQSLSDQEVRATDSLEISISKILGVLFNDVDDSTLTYSVRFESGTLPDWINVTDDADVYMLDFEPLQADTGCYNIIVEATDPAGATASDTFELCVNKLVVGISDLEAGVFEVSLYPNPTEGKVTLEHNIGTSDEMEISVMSINGSEVFRKSYRVGEEPVTFNLSDQVSGMYMVLIKVDDNVVIKKLVLDKK